MMTDEIPTPIEDFIPDPKAYWVLYAHTADWQILLTRLILEQDPTKGEKPLDPKIAAIGMKQGEITPIYYLSREHFPVERIAKLVGKEPAALAGIETLHLREFKDAEGKPAQTAWQSATVSYWGMG